MKNTENNVTNDLFNGDSKVIFSIASSECESWPDFEVVKFKSGPDTYYTFSLEQMLGFDTREELNNYLLAILAKFETWMKENGYSTTVQPHNGMYMPSSFDSVLFYSIEELYIFVKSAFVGFVNI